MANPPDLKRVRPLGDDFPATTEPNSNASSQANFPSEAAFRRSPYSILPWDRSSTTMDSKDAIASGVSSEWRGWLPPQTLTCASGATSRPLRKGVGADVIVDPTSALVEAAPGESAAVALIPCSFSFAANAVLCEGLGDHTFASSIVRTACKAWTWVMACLPAPKMASRAEGRL